jgi:hypothetical protein
MNLRYLYDFTAYNMIIGSRNPLAAGEPDISIAI